MGRNDKRLRGWKSIATYLGVTQSTAIRWSKQPGFPVTRASEGGSVYSVAADLDAWLIRSKAAVAEQDVGEPVPDPIATMAPRNRRGLFIGLLIAGLVAVAATILFVALSPHRDTAMAGGSTTSDPDLNKMYVQARADWAARTPASLARSIEEFRTIVARYPNYTPGFTGLADAYILSCEFDATARQSAFDAARAAAATALALSPADPDANRIRGFLEYWTTRDIAAARPYFERALATSAPTYLTQLWYGNALVDAGDLGAGIDRLNQALLAAPDSPAVLADYAIAKWQAGDGGAAVAALQQVERRNPDFSAAPGMLSLFLLADGDVAGFLDHGERWAALIGDPQQSARLATARRAFATVGAKAALQAIARADPIEGSPFWHGGNLESAIAASVAGDREQLIAILRRPHVRVENWRPMRFPAAAFLRWREDATVAPLLDQAFGHAFQDFAKP